MGEDYQPIQGSKQQKYQHLLEEMEFRVDKANYPLSNLANVLSMLKVQFNWYWVGFYIVHSNCLVLGPFQGPPACPKIFKGQGVCGICWEKNETIAVENVNKFEGHIACSSKSQSEIVLPIRRNNEFIGLLDIDSEQLANFDEIDEKNLSKILGLLEIENQFDIWK